MTQPRRIDGFGREIDRARPLSLRFDGVGLGGFAGDTIASALLAGGVRVVARSYKYRRARGIFAAGAEEPNAVFTVGNGARQTPNVQAATCPLADGMRVRSQSGYPSPSFDLGAAASLFSRLLPAGFYYKTFMRPRSLWASAERALRYAASGAPVPQMADPDCYAHRYAHCDVLVVGAGPAGLAAARAAAAAGARVMIVDEKPRFGGDLLADPDAEIDSVAGHQWAAQVQQELAAAADVTVLPNTTAQGFYDYNFLTALEETGADSGEDAPRKRLWKIRAGEVVVAAGAIERPPVFADNDRPGVMLASAVRAYLVRFGVLAGRRILFFTGNDSAYDCAAVAREAGAEVAIADMRADPGERFEAARTAGAAVHSGCAVVGVKGARGVVAAQLAALADDGERVDGNARLHPCDIIAVSGGWTPSVHLFSQARGRLRFDAAVGAFVPAEKSPINRVRCAGAANGVLDLAGCLREGAAAGRAAAADAGFAGGDCPPPQTGAAPAAHPPRHLALTPTIRTAGGRKHFVDLASDVTADDIFLAAREGYDSAEHVKRYTVAGFGSDQGKTANINTLAILARARGGANQADDDARRLAADQIGHTTFRPHYTPVTFGAVVGAARGELFAQERTTPMHDWHIKRGAIFEDVGDWKRARYYPQEGETMADATRRECEAVRASAGAMDATTLGKIDVQGADAARFLDLMYSNKMSDLRVGRCRYGLMLNEHGMIFDDGVCARLGENHFHLTTTTGGAARVMSWLEEWLQTEWPHLRVFCTSVTEQWAVAALAGPSAREILAALADFPTDPAALPFMAVREGKVAGVDARVFRVSFSGESGFEINVPARFGLHLWKALFAQEGLTPYGTETMHILRAEKGFIIVGQDTDGSATPADMGLDWMVAGDKEFLGRRSLSRVDTARAGRKQLVGILTDDEALVLPEGIHLINEMRPHPPMAAQGHITSSYFSAALGRSIALAMIKNGRARIGETLIAPLRDGRAARVKICAPMFWDKEGKRSRG